MRILKLSAACLLIGASYAAAAAVQKYDGRYKGTIVHTGGAGRCGITKPQKRMTVIDGGNLTFVFSKAMTMTGPVQDDGSFVATGNLSVKRSMAHFELKGKIENNALNAELASQLHECIYKVEQKKT